MVIAVVVVVVVVVRAVVEVVAASGSNTERCVCRINATRSMWSEVGPRAMRRVQGAET